MGLGKTLTSLTTMAHYHPHEWPLLVICPSSLRYTWPAEVEKFCPTFAVGAVRVVEGFSDDKWAEKVPSSDGEFRIKREIKILILSYSLLRDPPSSSKVPLLTALLRSIVFDSVIVDESHNLKIKASQKTVACCDIMKKAKRLILLSGTRKCLN
jgi:SWI/SNF-related matrix-associated actin-dependent regulator 1 of chromatin subfamily A